MTVAYQGPFDHLQRILSASFFNKEIVMAAAINKMELRRNILEEALADSTVAD